MIHVMYTSKEDAVKGLQDREVCNLYTEYDGKFKIQISLDELNHREGEFIHAWCKEKGE